MRHLPNIICLARIALVWPLILSLQAGDFDRTLWVFLIAAFSDGLDGYLAKRFGWTSELGKFLDPVADKLLLVSLYLLTTWLGLVPPWLTFLAVTRDVMIGSGALVYQVVCGPLRGRPIWLSKLNTLMQLLYLLAVVLHAGHDFPPQSLLDAMAVLTAVTLVLSGWAYVHEFTRRAITAAESP
jgi:cardiolipin synthase (CMP-forming)